MKQSICVLNIMQTPSNICLWQRKQCFHPFWTTLYVRKASQIKRYAEIKCTMPSKATVLWECVRCFYQ